MTGSKLEKVLLGMMLSSAAALNCNLDERNLLTHYIVINDGGTGVYHRVFLDKKDENNPLRCVVEYDISGVEPMHNKYIITFGEPRYYVDK